MPNRVIAVAVFCLAFIGSAGQGFADTDDGKAKMRTGGNQDYVTGRPVEPSDAWMLSFGGRLYDNWMDTLGVKPPAGNHPAYPKSAKQTGTVTWRCKECHGWDYKGANGQYAKGSHYTGIKGINDMAGMESSRIVKILQSRIHGYGSRLDDLALKALALFVSKGQHDTERFIDPKTGRVKGNAQRGAAIFQTVCAACHGFDGKTLDWGTAKKPAYVGTESNANPWEVLHKIRNAHPGAAMASLRALPLRDAIDVLTYARTLPVK